MNASGITISLRELPNYARDYQFRSFAWFETGHLPQALNDIDRSIELDPTDAASLQQRGNVLLALNRLDDARDAFVETLKISPEESGAWNNLGLTLVGLGWLEEAIPAFHSGMKCKPPSQNAFLGMAFVQIRLGRLDDATATLDQLDKLNGAPEAATLAARSVIARRRGNSQQADELEHKANALDANAVRWAIEQSTKLIPNQ